MGARFGNIDKFKQLLAQATEKPYSFLYLDLYGKPAKAFSNFTDLIYEAPACLHNASITTNYRLPGGEDLDDDL